MIRKIAASRIESGRSEMFGFPSCAYKDCWLPAFFQVRNERDGQELMVDLCVLHLKAAPKAVKEMQSLRHGEQPPLLGHEEGNR